MCAFNLKLPQLEGWKVRFLLLHVVFRRVLRLWNALSEASALCWLHPNRFYDVLPVFCSNDTSTVGFVAYSVHTSFFVLLTLPKELKVSEKFEEWFQLEACWPLLALGKQKGKRNYSFHFLSPSFLMCFWWRSFHLSPKRLWDSHQLLQRDCIARGNCNLNGSAKSICCVGVSYVCGHTLRLYLRSNNWIGMSTVLSIYYVFRIVTFWSHCLVIVWIVRNFTDMISFQYNLLLLVCYTHCIYFSSSLLSENIRRRSCSDTLIFHLVSRISVCDFVFFHAG